MLREKTMQDVNKTLDEIVAAVGQVLLGKDEKIRLALACMLAKGHLLLEDLPGMGKTTFAHALAAVLGFSYRRVQFTSDMLPADILGTNIFDPEKREFVLHRGPIFTQLLLADEINRSSPKTQSALLEAMEEKQVSIDGQSTALPDPFFCDCNAESAASVWHLSTTRIAIGSVFDADFLGVSRSASGASVVAR